MPTTVLDIAGATMATQRHLPRAPITEALIDLRVQPQAELKFDDLSAALGIFEFKLPPAGQAPETAARWQIYVHRTSPKRVTRVSTHFINNLQLPLSPGESFQTYLNKVVDVPAEAPQSVEGF